MKNLSIFVDESGDFGEYFSYSPYYVISMVIHDQSNDTSSDVRTLDSSLRTLGLDDLCIHTEPLIRKEESYSNMDPSTRRAILCKLYYFALRVNINFTTFLYDKKDFKDSLVNVSLKLEAKMTRDINLFVSKNIEYFDKFNNIILYYDNGQKNITRILNAILATNFSNYEVRKVMPKNYKLFQVADLLCTLELISNKIENNQFSRSEGLIFKSKSDFKKDFIKNLWKKKL